MERGEPLGTVLQGMCGVKFIQWWFAGIIDLPSLGACKKKNEGEL